MGLVARVAPACFAVDTSTKLTADQAKAIKAAGYKGVGIAGIGRYCSISQPNLSSDISPAELEDICRGAGLGCWLVQHVRYGVGSAQSPEGWTPSEQLGTLDGLVARRHAALAGYPAGAHLALDLEGVNPKTPAEQVSAHCVSWGMAVEDGATSATTPSYPGLLYDGYSADLSPEQLWELPAFRLYWSDFGSRTLPNRGFVMKQIEENVVIAGVKCDVNLVLEADALGGQLVWCVWED